ncbi:uncharacterized protein LOC141630325 [Silene latifolia]|uniref:uncharacterized protein LOC141630325 n=1 Tax=Silene latifolia TaxID=37657 RepID=UPI003D77923E
MTVAKSPSKSTPKNSSKIQKNSETVCNNKFDLLSHTSNEEFPALTKTNQVPTSADVLKVKAIHEVVGIPPLNLEVLVEDVTEEAEDETEEAKSRKNVTALPVIEEKPSGVLQFTAVEVKVELDYWKNSVYCFILGANPPWDIVEGYIRRLWINPKVDKLSFLPNGVFMVRFLSKAAKDVVLRQGHFLLDNKPLIVKPWTPDVELVKHEVKSVPVWVKLHKLPLKFWGKGLTCISGLIRKFIKCDLATEDKTRIGYARVMIELMIGDPLPDKVKFLDEHGIGHTAAECRRSKKTQAVVPNNHKPAVKVWKPKTKATENVQKAKPVKTHVQSPSAVVVAAASPVETQLQTLVVWHSSGTYSMGPAPAPAKATTIGRLSRQDISEGGYTVHRFGQHTFLETLNTPTPKVGIGISGLFGLLETKVKALSLNIINGLIVDGWSIATNNSWHKGGRVWILWNPAIFILDFYDFSAQCINMKVTEVASSTQFYVSMVYAFNDLVDRRSLWNQLIKFASIINGPWMVAGAFNCVFSHSERLGGSSTDAEIDEFQSCLDACGLIDSPAQGAYYTWNNKQDEGSRVFSRLDRVLINSEWSQKMPSMYAHFLPEGTFDHTPCIIKSSDQSDSFKRPFKYYNMWGKEKNFIPKLTAWWTVHCQGTKMFQVVRKLKNLKVHLRQFNKDHFALILKMQLFVALRNLEAIQINLIDDPSNQQMLNMESHAVEEYKKLQADYSKGQKHSAPQAVKDAFLNYYKELLGTAVPTDKVNFQIIKRGQVCDASLQDILILPVTNQEIKTTIFSIPDHKAPGPDVQDVFNSGKLLKQLNATNVTLIPKCKMPTYVHQFRPIACCNVLYKCVSKILCNRISLVLPELISKNQGGFIKGRSILENIMVCQDLVRLYNRQFSSARCMFKMDLMKAYNSVSWDFLADILEAFNFPVSIRRLIMECVSSATYTLSLNGDTFGFFPGKRGLRQGDPISPLLFTLCMEYFTRIIDCATEKLPFHFHPLCKPIRLTHLMFADDLLLFCKGDAQSIMVLLRAYESFSRASGLKMNPQKSCAYFNGVPSGLKKEILSVSGIKEGSLPFKYLGVPITAGRLKKSDYGVLIDKIVERIRYLGAKKLSFAGRLVLVKSVLSTMYNYWASLFVLPKGVMNRVDVICRNFLWEGSTEHNKAPLLAWHKVCVPQKEGGLVLESVQYGMLLSLANCWHWSKVCHVRDTIKEGFSDGIWSIGVGDYSSGFNVEGEVIQVADFYDDDSLYRGLATESHAHFFQDCRFSQEIYSYLAVKLGGRLDATNQLQSIMKKRWSRLRKQVTTAILLAAWYLIWNKRNEARLFFKVSRPELIAEHIWCVIHTNIRVLSPRFITVKDKLWLSRVHLM